MARLKKPPKSSLRSNIMIAFFLALILLGVSITATSHHVLHRAFLDSDLPAESVQHIGRQVTQMLTGFTLAGTVVAILIAALLSRTITEPLRRLLAGVAEIGAGNLGAHIDIAGDDELGQLAAAFNDMAQKLKQSHDHLETTVEQRTAELTQTNQKLQTEIAERWRTEEELKESLSLLEATLESTADGILVADGRGRIKDFNRTFVDIWGIPESVVEAKDDDKALSFVLSQLKDPDAFVTRVRELYHQPEEESLDRLEFKDGRVIERYSKPQVIGSRIVGRVWSFRDITERQRAEERLQAAMEEWMTTFDAIADPVSIQNADCEIIRVNKAFAQMVGKEPEELVGRKCYEAVHGTEQPWPTCPHRCTLREGKPHTQAFFEPNLGCHVEVATWPVLDKKGQIEGSVHIIKNIDDRKNTEAKQALLIRQLEEVNEELTHFAYVVSHDLKAPLRGIKLLTEWLCNDYSDQLGDDAKENLDLLQSRVDRMHNLIEGVLQYSRVGRIKEDVVEVDLNELLPCIIDAIAPPEHVTITVEGPLPNIECEQTRITQVFQNLLTNAVKYMDKPLGEVTVACADRGDAWTFRISDNGPGIEEKYFDRIFRIFQTLAPRDEFESTGVGLTLVKKIVELYGGRIWVESGLGQGSTFFFTLPKQEAETRNESVRTDAIARHGHLQETGAISQER